MTGSGSPTLAASSLSSSVTPWPLRHCLAQLSAKPTLAEMSSSGLGRRRFWEAGRVATRPGVSSLYLYLYQSIYSIYIYVYVCVYNLYIIYIYTIHCHILPIYATTGAGIFIYLQNWVLNMRQFCRDSYSSTMEHLGWIVK